MRLFALALAGCLVAAPASAFEYSVDATFASNSALGGWTRQYFGNGDEKTIGFARDSAATNAGFILAMSVTGGTNGQRIGLIKLDRDGNRVSTGFGTEGRVLTDLGFLSIDAMTVDANGRIVVAGSRPGVGGVGDFAVARFKADGSVDAGFGVNGVASHTFEVASTGYDEASRSVLAETDGKVVVTGNVGIPGNSNRFGLFRLNANGTLDTTFGNISNGSGGFRGAMERFYGTRDAYASTVLKVANGQYVVVGTSTYSSTDTDFAARLFLPTGQAWANDAGTINLPVDEPGTGGSLYDTATAAVAVDPLTVLVVGTASGHAAARRFKLDDLSGGLYGSLVNDASFVGSGISDRPYRYVSQLASTTLYANGVAVRGNGDALLVGRMTDQTVAGRQLGFATRLRRNGQPDLVFASTDGTAVEYAPTLGTGISWYTELTDVLYDGARAVLAGSAVDSTTVVNDFDAVVTRLQTDMIYANGFQ